MYSHDDFDETYTFPLIKKVSKCMLDKIKSYKAEQLPGGKLWNPDPETRKELAKIKPPMTFVREYLASTTGFKSAPPISASEQFLEWWK